MKEFLIDNIELVSIFASIGTFISSLIAIYTLIEVKKQRLSTYKPEILIKSFLVYISKSPLFVRKEELLEFSTANFNEYHEKKEKSETIYNISPLYKVENLGFGPAKNIKLTWSFDIAKALNLIETEFPEDLYFSQHKPLKYFFLNKRNDDDFHLSLTNEKIHIHNIDYIPPINIKEHKHSHVIPKDILVAHFLYYVLKNKLTKKINENSFGCGKFDEFPKVKLRIDYFDLNKKKYTQKYCFKTSIVTTQVDKELDTTKEFGYLLFELK